MGDKVSKLAGGAVPKDLDISGIPVGSMTELLDMKTVWKLIQKKGPQIAKDTLLKHLKQRPEFKKLHGLMGVPDEELPQNSKFKDASNKFFNVIGGAMNKVDKKPAEAMKVLDDAGEEYAKEGFTKDYFSSMQEPFMSAAKTHLADKFTDQAAAGAKGIFGMVTEKIGSHLPDS